MLQCHRMVLSVLLVERFLKSACDIGHQKVSVICLLQDGSAMLWDLNEGKHLYTLGGGEVINALVFSPNRYWLCAATGQAVKIWVCLTWLQENCR